MRLTASIHKHNRYLHSLLSISRSIRRLMIFSLPLTVKAEFVSLNQLLGLKTHTANRVDGLNL